MREMVPSVAYVMAVVLLLCRLDRGYARCYITPNAEGHVVWNVSTLGDSAGMNIFGGCTALKTISFVNGNLKHVTSAAFRGSGL